MSGFAEARVPRHAREPLAKLLADPALAALRDVLAEEGARAWIVGGALRDLVLRREVAEVDLAVDGDAEKIARRMESLRRGRAVLLSGDRSPRVFRVAGRGRTLDLAEIEGGSIDADLSRRDFTANSVAVDLASGELLDPFGGLADLASKRLRLVAEKNLADDPLRALRAARLSATHGLTPDRETSRACRRAAPAIARVARERVQAELDKLLGARRAVPALTWAAGAGLFEPALGLPLSPRRARAVARALAPLDSPSAGRLPADRRRRLRLALLAHRLKIGRAEAATWLRRLRSSNEEASAVARLLALADRARERPKGDDVWRFLLEAGEGASDALLLLQASDPGSRPIARRLRTLARRRRAIPSVSGADVLEWLDIPPGPEVGRFLEAVRVEALAGRIRTKGEARDWLRGRKAAGLAQPRVRGASGRSFRL
jgi:tRNA nucleotidyltransferase (CCA-adding enzyme)